MCGRARECLEVTEWPVLARPATPAHRFGWLGCVGLSEGAIASIERALISWLGVIMGRVYLGGGAGLSRPLKDPPLRRRGALGASSWTEPERCLRLGLSAS